MIKKLSQALILIILGVFVSIASFALYDWHQEYQYARLARQAIKNPVKVFQIGFSKCGTTTIAEFFNDNGIPAVHHDFGHLATSIFNNAKDGMPLIAPQYARYFVFTDMERMYDFPPLSVGMTYFKELDQQYPGSKFILNIRDKQAWLKSRATHPVDRKDARTILDVNANMLDLTSEQVLAKWSQEWDHHIAQVLEYFKNRPQDLLVFDIEKDPPEKLVAFFQDNFVLDAKLYKHKNKTVDKNKTKDEPVEQVAFFSKIYKLDPNIRIKHQQIVKQALIKPVKVFQIGFSKCGTTTLAHFFKENGIASVHHDYGKLAMSIYHNHQEGKPLLNEEYQQFYVYTDMERMYGMPPINIGQLLFKELDKQYPGSKFILNTRNKDAWLKSRAQQAISQHNKTTLLERNMQLLGITQEELLAKWSREWDAHHMAVLEYFKNRPQDLLVFNIEEDDPQKLILFFKDHFYLDASKYEHKNRTVARN